MSVYTRYVEDDDVDVDDDDGGYGVSTSLHQVTAAPTSDHHRTAVTPIIPCLHSSLTFMAGQFYVLLFQESLRYS